MVSVFPNLVLICSPLFCRRVAKVLVNGVFAFGLCPNFEHFEVCRVTEAAETYLYHLLGG